MKESQDYVNIQRGLAERPSGRRVSQGVALVLGTDARKAWEKAERQFHTYGRRVIGTRLQVFDSRAKYTHIFLVGAYASESSWPQAERCAYSEELKRCFDTCEEREVLVVGTDARASLEV